MIFYVSKAILLIIGGKTGHFVENRAYKIGTFNQMWNVIHRTHGGDTLLKKTFKKPLTRAFWDDIITKLTAKNAVNEGP